LLKLPLLHLRPARNSPPPPTQCATPLLDEGIAADRITLARSVDLRYSVQNYEIEVGWDADLGALRAAFEVRHRRLYGYATGESVECVNLRLTARVVEAHADLPLINPVGTLTPVGSGVRTSRRRARPGCRAICARRSARARASTAQR